MGLSGSPYTLMTLPFLTCTMCQQADGQKEQPPLTTLSAIRPSSGLRTSFSVKGYCSKVVLSFHLCIANAFSTPPTRSESSPPPPPMAVVFKKLLLFNSNFNSSSNFIISHPLLRIPVNLLYLLFLFKICRTILIMASCTEPLYFSHSWNFDTFKDGVATFYRYIFKVGTSHITR